MMTTMIPLYIDDDDDDDKNDDEDDDNNQIVRKASYLLTLNTSTLLPMASLNINIFLTFLGIGNISNAQFIPKYQHI